MLGPPSLQLLQVVMLPSRGSDCTASDLQALDGLVDHKTKLTCKYTNTNLWVIAQLLIYKRLMGLVDHKTPLALLQFMVLGLPGAPGAPGTPGDPFAP